MKWKDIEFNTKYCLAKESEKGKPQFSLNATITTATKYSILEIYLLECCKNKSLSLNPINLNDADHFFKMLLKRLRILNILNCDLARK